LELGLRRLHLGPVVSALRVRPLLRVLRLGENETLICDPCSSASW